MTWSISNVGEWWGVNEIDDAKSDRVVAIVGGAMLDDALQRVLEGRLRPKSGKTDINAKLPKVGGPLGNLEPKINLAYQLYVVEKPVRNAMWGICAIRNQFAHEVAASFVSPGEEIRDALAKLTLHVGRRFWPNPFDGYADGPQPIGDVTKNCEVFIANLKLCMMWLLGDSSRHSPWTNETQNSKREA